MTEIKQWAFGLTISAILGAIILSVTPGGATEKLVRTAVSLFIMCALLYPFINQADATAIFKTVEFPEAEFSEITYEETGNFLEERLRKKIAAILSETGINGPDISISINIENGSDMKIEAVSVYADEKYRDHFAEAEKELRSQLGIEVKIGVKK